jgi:hypothetical protein
VARRSAQKYKNNGRIGSLVEGKPRIQGPSSGAEERFKKGAEKCTPKLFLDSLARDLLRVNGYAMALLFGHENLLQLLHLLIF